MTFYTNVLQYGNSLLVREVDSKGQRIKKRVQYEPTLFDLVTTKEKTGYVTLDGKQVLPHKFDSIKEGYSTHVKIFKIDFNKFEEYRN